MREATESAAVERDIATALKKDEGNAVRGAMDAATSATALELAAVAEARALSAITPAPELAMAFVKYYFEGLDLSPDNLAGLYVSCFLAVSYESHSRTAQLPRSALPSQQPASTFTLGTNGNIATLHTGPAVIVAALKVKSAMEAAVLSSR